MASSYTSLLGLALPVTGELSGSWGDVVNDSITSLLDSAVAGTTTLSTDGDVTLSTTTGASNQARQAILLCSGARTALRTITAPAQSKIYTVINATTGGYSVKVVGAGPTTGVTIVAGESAVIAWNGSDFIKVSNTGGSASFTNVTVSGTTTLSGLTASTALALDASKNVVSVTNTGTGNNVLSASPTLTGTLAAAAATFSGDVTLGDASTDTVTVNGYMGVGGAGSSAFGVTVGSTALTGVSQAGFYSAVTGNSSATTGVYAFSSLPRTAASAFTSTTVAGFYAFNASKGAGSTITNQHGLYIADQTQGTNNFGITSAVSSGSNKFNIYASGTAQNYFAGNVGIGTDSPGQTLVVSGPANTIAQVVSTTNTASARFYATNSDGDNFELRMNGRSAATNAQCAIISTPTTSVPLLFMQSGVERMRLDNVGFGIGTSSPTNALSVTGSANITGNTTLGDATTDTVTVNGYVGVGGAAQANIGLYIRNTALSNTAQYGVYNSVTGTSSATSAIAAYVSAPATAAAAFTAVTVYGFLASNATLGAGSTITNLHGLYIVDQTQGTNNYGITSLVSSGTNKWNIYASGTADNYFAGRVGFGTTSLGGGSGQYRFSGSITGATTSSGLLYTPTIQSDATANAYVFHSQPSTAAAAFTITNLVHYHATQATIGAGSTVTNQFGFNVQSTLTGATNNYGFYGGIASGTGRWNLYMAGTADNYFAGNLGIGTSSPGYKLDVVGAGVFKLDGSGSTTPLILRNNNTASTQLVKLGFDSSGTIKASINAAVYGNDYMTFNVGSDTERMRIDSSGNVGIGTSSPQGKLSVSNGTIFVGSESNTTQTNNLLNGYGYRIGTTLYGNVSVRSTYSQVTNAASLEFYVGSSGTTTAEAMRLDSAGDLGIGTSSPGYKLDVRGTGNQTIAVRTQTSGDAKLYLENAGSNAGSITYSRSLQSLLFSGQDATTHMTLNSSGNFGLGVTPSAWASSVRALEMTTGAFYSYASGSVSNFYNLTNAYLNSAGNPIYKQSSFASQYLQTAGQHQWYNAPSGTAGAAITFTQAMTLDASGNLLVGTTSSSNLRLNEKFAIVGAGTGNATGVGLTGYSGTTSTGRPIIDFNRSRGTTDGSFTAVASGDSLGSLIFRGADGTAFQDAAMISAEVDGATGTNDMPGRLSFYTTSDATNLLVERMRLNSSGNLGLGVTPSAWWSSRKVLQLGNAGGSGGYGHVLTGSNVSYVELGANYYTDSTPADKYIATGFATRYYQFNGSHIWQNVASGTAGTTFTFTQAMTLDASGNLGVGTTSPTARIHSNGTIQSVTGSTGIQIYGDGGTGYVNSIGAYPLVFQVNSTERARIDSSGNLLVGTTSAIGGSRVISPTGFTSRSVALTLNGTSTVTVPNGCICTMAVDGFPGDSAIFSIKSIGGFQGCYFMAQGTAGNIGFGTTSNPSTGTRLNVWISGNNQMSIQDVGVGARTVYLTFTAVS